MSILVSPDCSETKHEHMFIIVQKASAQAQKKDRVCYFERLLILVVFYLIYFYFREKCLQPLQLALESKNSKFATYALGGIQVSGEIRIMSISVSFLCTLGMIILLMFNALQDFMPH